MTGEWIASEQGGYVIAAGTTPEGKYQRTMIEPDGTARLSDETVERIARRVVELMRTPEPFDLGAGRSDPWE